MLKKKKIFLSILIWIISFLITVFIAVYQRYTGPTHPVGGKIIIGNEKVAYKLPRSSDSEGDESIMIKVKNPDIAGEIRYKRYKSYDSWTVAPMTMTQDTALLALIPHQPPAGKVVYQITLNESGQSYVLTEKPVIIRFRGQVPVLIVILHVIFIFLAMLFAVRTGLEAVMKWDKTYIFTIVTMILFFIGGFILGPLMQKYAFGAYWTGFPYGHDLTDNKIVIPFIFWIIAFFKLRKNRQDAKWAIIAAIAFLIIYLIPHSLLGSELNYMK